MTNEFMAVFCPKKLVIAKPVGQILKEARESQGWELEAVAKRARIPAKYLRALEEGKRDELPSAKAFQAAYVREYAEELHLNPSVTAHLFWQESVAREEAPRLPKTFMKIYPLCSISFLVRNLVIALFVIGFIGYLGWQVKGILEPPRLNLYAPEEGYVTSESRAVVQGDTEKEARLMINGKEVMPSESGRFEATIDLLRGVNTITVSAIKKHGKTTTITRHVVVKNELKNKEKMTWRTGAVALDKL